MKKLSLILGAAFMAAIIFTGCGESYDEVTIGNQVWMQKNLNVENFRNGDPIPHAKTKEEWIKAGKEGKPAWCYYDNDPANGEKYGKLYNWYAVNDPRGLAPKGWHVPTDEEWKTLEMELGMSLAEAYKTNWRGTNEGSKLAGNAELWDDGDLVNHSEFGSSGFTALPGGYKRNIHSDFRYIGNLCGWWCAAEINTDKIWNRALVAEQTDVSREHGNKHNIGALSVRCLKD